MTVAEKLRTLHRQGRLTLPHPGSGATAERHSALMQLGREDLTLARLAEAHVDAIAILAEAGKSPAPGALYGVWAAESPHQALSLAKEGSGFLLSGSKMFGSGADIVDHALVTVRSPEHRLVDLDLRQNAERIVFAKEWIAAAFAETNTATAAIANAVVSETDLIGPPRWYLDRPGFWNGACGPAACWAGGAMGLVDYARRTVSDSPHGRAHVGAMYAAEWAMAACLKTAGDEIDREPDDKNAAVQRALAVRHTIEHFCSDILQRFGRTFGPRPLAFDKVIAQRYQEVELYIRQSHAEHDLETLGRLVTESHSDATVARGTSPTQTRTSREPIPA